MTNGDDDDDDLFKRAEAYARHGDPWTSHTAAKETEASKCEKLVWHKLAETRIAMTTYEIAKATGKDDGSITPRMKPLARKGLIMRAGHKIGPRGKPMTLWLIKRKPKEPASE